MNIIYYLGNTGKDPKNFRNWNYLINSQHLIKV